MTELAKQRVAVQPAATARIAPLPAVEAEVWSSVGRPVRELLAKFIDAGHFAPPSSRHDELTDLPTRAAFASHKFYARLEKDYPSGLLLGFLDADNMGMANAAKLNDTVNNVKRALGQTARTGFGEQAHELYIFGGDEFVFIADAGVNDPQVGVSRFLNEYFNVIDAALPLSNPQVKKAELYAELRTKARRALADYIERNPEFQIDQLIEQLEQQWNLPRGTADRANLLAQCFGEGFQKMLGDLRERLAQGDRRVMTLSAGTIRLEPPYTEEQINSALIQAQRLAYVHKTDRRAGGISANFGHEPDGSPLPPEMLERLGTRDADIRDSEVRGRIRQIDAQHATAGRMLRRLAEQPDSAEVQASAATLIGKMLQDSALDPSNPSASSSNSLNYRFDLVRRESAGDILGVTKRSPLYAIDFDITGFGPINAEIGYSRADELYGAVVDIARVPFPDARLVRKNGGGFTLLLLTDRAVLPAQLHGLLGQMEEQVEKLIGSAEFFERALARNAISVALRRSREPVQAGRIEPPFGSVVAELLLDPVYVKPGTSMEQLVRMIEDAESIPCRSGRSA